MLCEKHVPGNTGLELHGKGLPDDQGSLPEGSSMCLTLWPRQPMLSQWNAGVWPLYILKTETCRARCVVKFAWGKDLMPPLYAFLLCHDTCSWLCRQLDAELGALNSRHHVSPLLPQSRQDADFPTGLWEGWCQSGRHRCQVRHSTTCVAH